MSESKEEVYKFIEQKVKYYKLTLKDVKFKISNKFNTTLTQSDISFVEEKFANIAVRLWEDECKMLIIDKINELKGKHNELNSLVTAFNETVDFNSVTNLLKNDSYALIQRDRHVFNENSLVNAVNNILLTFKLKVKEIQSAINDEYMFLYLFCEVLRSSDLKFKSIMKALKLREFAQNKIAIDVVLKLIVQVDFDILSYPDVQKLAYSILKSRSYILEEYIHAELKLFADDFTTKILKEGDKNIVEYYGKIIFLEELITNLIPADEIRIFCEIFHIHIIDEQTYFRFNVDNLIIFADHIKVHFEVTFDLSGRNADHVEDSKAGTDDNGRGINGKDGNAGESGGNCFIKSTKIENSHWLTIISRGGNGGNAQSGGDGTDGANGENVTESDFYWHGFKFESKYFGKTISILVDHQYQDGNITKYFVSKKPGGYIFMLCKGSNGTKGKNGGLLGVGGEGGFNGEVDLEIPSNSVKIIASKGLDGKNGSPGYNGLSGKDGRDAWGYDHKLRSNRYLEGLNECSKYKLAFSKNNGEYYVWSRFDNKYVYAEKIGSVKSVSAMRVKNESTTSRSRSFHAIAERKEKSSRGKLTNKYAKKTLDHVKKEASKIADISVNVKMAKLADSTKVRTKDKVLVSFEECKVKKMVEESTTVELLSFDDAKKLLSSKKFTLNDFVEVLTRCNFTSRNFFELNGMVLRKEICVTGTLIGASKALEQKIGLNELCNQHKVISVKLNQAFITQSLVIPKKIQEIISYLDVSQTLTINPEIHSSLSDFEIDFATFEHYFNSDTSENRMQIKILYLRIKDILLETSKLKNWGKKILNFTKSVEVTNIQVKEKNDFVGLFMRIFKILIKHKEELAEIRDLIASVQQEYEACNFLQDSNEESLKQAEEVIKRFLENETVSNFIEHDIVERGISSPIYKKIIAFVFNVNLQIYIKNLDGVLCHFGVFKGREESELANLEEKNNSVDLLMVKNKYAVLKFDMKKYKIIAERKYFAEKAMTQYKIESDHSSLSWSLEQLLNYDKNNISIDNILKRFPNTIDEEIENVKLILQDIQASNGFKIINSINIQLMYEKNQITLHEFKLILLTILNAICENAFMIDFFALKLLALKCSDWIVELIILQLENYLKRNDFELMLKWRQHLCKINCHKILILFLNKIDQLEEQKVKCEDFNLIIDSMRYFTSSTYSELVKGDDLIDWKNVITTDYWLNKFSFLSHQESVIVNELFSKFSKKSLEEVFEIMESKSSSIKEINVLDFLKNFNTGEWIFGEDLFDILRNNEVKNWKSEIKSMYAVKGGQRSVEQIKKIIEKNNDTSKKIQEGVNNIEVLLTASLKHKSTYENYSKKAINNYISIIKASHEKSSIEKLLGLVLHVFKVETKVDLRFTQIISILTLWESNNGALIQVSTGEGKTFIGIALAILKFLNNEKVHIVTSSKVLAERDAKDVTNRRIFDYFGINCGHNCHEDSDERRRIYHESDIVYGILSNFQRDYLLTQFYDHNLIDKDKLQCVLVDEVDSILLDRGSNILYLSQELPGVEELESLFIFIWNWINQIPNNLQEMQAIMKSENIRSAVFENWRGKVHSDDIIDMIGDSNIESTKIIKKLKEAELIDEENSLNTENLIYLSEDLISSNLSALDLPSNLINNIFYYIQKTIKIPKFIKFPTYLNAFVLRHLDKWIKSAITAFLMEDEQEYVIDRLNDGSTVDSEPNIIIMDVDTGTDLTSSEWDEALCQFLQLKHGCKLSLYSLKSIFISNVSYFKLYKKLYGMTGTLGSITERENLTKFYELDYVTIPTFLPKKFIEHDAILARSNQKWLEEIVKETKLMFEQERSVLIICNTIQDIKNIQKIFNDQNCNEFKSENVVVYQRDYEEFNLEKLPPRRLIIASNLAGRGTDIKLTSDLEKNGGLHVILTYLASNVRVENQAYGRASRAGAKGSARLIIFNTRNESIEDLKKERNHNEIQRLSAVTTYYNNIIIIEEHLFRNFLNAYKNYASNITHEMRIALLNNLKILWTFWLDENSEKLKDMKNTKVETERLFQEFLSNTTLDNYRYTTLHPITRLVLARYFDLQGNEKELKQAEEVLREETNSGRDWDAHNYLSVHMILKRKSHDENYNQFCLKSSERRIIQKTLQKLYKSEDEEKARGTIITLQKENHRRTLIPIKGFEIHKSAIYEMQKVFTDSLLKFLGFGITPESFNCSPFGNMLVNEDFYEFLLSNNFISKPTISDILDKVDIKIIAKKFNLDSDLLQKFFNCKQNDSIANLDNFSQVLKNTFKFASREDFWDFLVQNDQLINEVEYAVINIKVLKDYHPFAAEKVFKKFKEHKINEFNSQKTSEIFLFDVIEDNEQLKGLDPHIIAINLSNEIKSDSIFKILMQKNIIKVNKRAQFNLKKYFENKSNFKFDVFDSITKDDFEEIEGKTVREEIISSLENQKILIKSTNCLSYTLNYEKYQDLDLGKNSIREDEVKDILKFKFAYRCAYEDLALKINENVQNEISSLNKTVGLYLNPHLMIIQDLIANFVIVPSKVNKNKIEDLARHNKFDIYMRRDDITDYLRNGLLGSGLTLESDINMKYFNIDDLVEELLRENALFTLNSITQVDVQDLCTHDNDKVKKHLKEKGIENVKFYFDRIKNFKFCDFKNHIFIQEKDIKLSSNFKEFESTVQVLLDRKRLFAENKNAIIKTIKDAVEALNSNAYQNPKPVLVPLKTIVPSIQYELLNYLELKGFSHVIQVEEKIYTVTFFVNVFFVIAIGVAQIAAGVAITLLTKGFLINVGHNLVSEGIGDIIFAITTLTSGTFRWKDYINHKMMSVVITTATFGIAMGLSRIKCLKRFFSSAKCIGDKVGKGFKNMSGIQMMKQSGKTGVAASKMLWEQGVKEVMTSCAKATTMAGVSMVVDYAVNNILDNVMLKLSMSVTETLHGKFNMPLP